MILRKNKDCVCVIYLFNVSVITFYKNIIQLHKLLTNQYHTLIFVDNIFKE